MPFHNLRKGMKLRISSEGVGELFATTSDENPTTVERIAAALPLEGEAIIWGDEIYFNVDLVLEPENQREVVAEGDIAFWLEGSSVCIFFGKTPISKEGEIRAYSPVNVFARVDGDVRLLRRVKQGQRIRIERSTPSPT